MAPKKKDTKKGNDDWEADLGESVDPIAAASQEAKEIDAAQDAPGEDTGGGGGLLAALKKNKTKKQKKGKPVQEDYLDGEDQLVGAGDAVNGGMNGISEAPIKAPEEANADDLFAAESTTKAKGGKGKPEPVPKEDEDESEGEGGGLKSKKEKEREKKEREKQRKKEQVCWPCCPNIVVLQIMLTCDSSHTIGCEEENYYPYTCT